MYKNLEARSGAVELTTLAETPAAGLTSTPYSGSESPEAVQLDDEPKAFYSSIVSAHQYRIEKTLLLYSLIGRNNNAIVPPQSTYTAHLLRFRRLGPKRYSTYGMGSARTLMIPSKVKVQ
jgi:hypothetical protein